jgi:hypothetical protein
MEKFNYSFTSREDDCLTEMISYFFDLGLPEGIDPEAFDSVSEKILLGRASAK